MKRVALILILSTNLYFISAAMVSAQTGEEADVVTTTDDTDTQEESTVTRQKRIEDQKAALEEKKAALGEKKTERVATREAMKEELKENRIERLSDVANMRFERILRRYTAAIARLAHIIERFNTRLETLADEGHDVSQAQAFVDTASDHVAQAELLLSEAESEFPAVLASENPTSSFATVKDTFKEAKDELIAAHTALRSALAEIKTFVNANRMPESDSEATGTAEVPEL
ncbi:MAG: hypothetical protein NUV98_03665 [Candidatus Roizmanbacteria bacterium]|nr:hypothetical protein [Candidatus Roizmanbacteria bacterium]